MLELEILRLQCAYDVLRLLSHDRFCSCLCCIYSLAPGNIREWTRAREKLPLVDSPADYLSTHTHIVLPQHECIHRCLARHISIVFSDVGCSPCRLLSTTRTTAGPGAVSSQTTTPCFIQSMQTHIVRTQCFTHFV